MGYFFRRRGIWKALLSLSFVFVTLIMVHKLRFADEGASKGLVLKSRLVRVVPAWFETGNTVLKRDLNTTSIPPHTLTERTWVDQLPYAFNQSASRWDVRTINCSENTALNTQGWFKNLDSRFQQFVLYRHCRYFPMVLNHPEKCQGDVHLLIVVKSVIEHHERREAVRNTWGKEHEIDGKKIRTLFLLGAPSLEKDSLTLQKLLEYEDKIYGDILQWDFMDTFFNLTLKEVNFLKWFNIYCTNVKFIFKGDDDVFVHTGNVLEFLDYRKDDPGVKNLFVGDIIKRAIPIRNKQSKYFIPKELYNKPYPPYAGGGGFLMASPLAKTLLSVSEGIQLFPIDDVFLGMCLQKARTSPEVHQGFRTFGISRRLVSTMNSDPCFYKSLLVVHKLSSTELQKMWEVVHHGHLKCARKV
ncbi:UDP-GlcNAc:betaGal beta-1,3-N-acetylglucosaminyltransferase 7, like [Latimeria chalumnae]|nr:PREDICTED: UDP-GlcNAc:betaGal beta-1,3-N-acetylglucosaminyltransferase 7-like [Latimeria chalumnae]|eukprot:XP_005986101.1 PREDICTED: UDP-GlcNAc:betaGal beta-1,3-N-acetylglucosaminyltransferase 7-like [Latimeria chalumnae]